MKPEMRSIPLQKIPKLLIASYIVDWIVVLIFGILSLVFSIITPNFRPFSLLDLSISFPNKPELFSTADLSYASVLAPAIIIAIVCLVAVPSPTVARSTPKNVAWRMKLWEWHAGWLGLALSLTTGVLIVSGLKNIVGKPRPDMLARSCLPNIQNIAANIVGGYGQDISSRWTLVDQNICTQTDTHLFHDGFRSFPSGHSQTSFSGLLFLTLFLCNKFGIAFPWLAPKSYLPEEQQPSRLSVPEARVMLPRSQLHANGLTDNHRQAAAPPLYLLLFSVYLPVGVALFICASRFFDYRHHGFDIIAGALIGILTAWFAFRWTCPPLMQSFGYAWGPRSSGRAFGAGIGSHGFVGGENAAFERPTSGDDVEMGAMHRGSNVGEG